MPTIVNAPNGEDTSPALTDKLAISGSQYLQLANLLKIINGLTEDTDPDIAADYVATYDASASGPKKVLLKNAGRIIQAVHTQTGAVATGTTTIPVDDTIPQNTEGTEFITLAITPTDASNKLIIEAVLNVAVSALVNLTAALFQDTTADALNASMVTVPGADYSMVVCLKHEMTAGTTSATTFKVRAGGGGASTVTLNGFGGARKLGGVLISSLRIMEVKV